MSQTAESGNKFLVVMVEWIKLLSVGEMGLLAPFGWSALGGLTGLAVV